MSACQVGQGPIAIRISTNVALIEASVAQTKYVITLKEVFNVNVDKVIKKCKMTAEVSTSLKLYVPTRQLRNICAL